MEPVLEVRNLSVSYTTRHSVLRALRDVSLYVDRGETFGIVGESGCGKSTLAFSILRYLDRNGRIDSGQILIDGEDIVPKSAGEIRSIWGKKISMVFQDPSAALNPSMRIGEQVAEVVVRHRNCSWKQAWEDSEKMLAKLQIPDPEFVAKNYPHQLSGGMRQRVCIGMALITNPKVLVMDEPTTSLDVTTESNILDMIKELKREYNTAIIYITHDLGVVYKVSDRIGVMYGGQMIEEGGSEDIIRSPIHPYTRGLLNTIPKLRTGPRRGRLKPIQGSVIELINMLPECTFRPRCAYAQAECAAAVPEFLSAGADRKVRCFRAAYVQSVKGDGRCDISAEKIFKSSNMETGPETDLLSLKDVKKHYESSSRWFGLKNSNDTVRAVDGITLSLKRMMTVGLVGESGCGKSTLIRTIIGLEEITSGTLLLDGLQIRKPVSKRPKEVTRRVQMVFQDPRSTLNPKKTIGQAVLRPIIKNGVSRLDAVKRAREILESVNMGMEYMDRYPDQLSGGQKQRIAIARAFSGHPDLVLCDEPTSALDVSIQAAIINLLIDLQLKEGTAYIFISHDLGVVSNLCDLMVVMYLGKIVEYGPTDKVISPPLHPYTESLLSSISVADPGVQQRRIRLSDSVPSARAIPKGCRFHNRCPRKIGMICEEKEPPLVPTDKDGDHLISCHIAVEELALIEPVFRQG